MEDVVLDLIAIQYRHPAGVAPVLHEVTLRVDPGSFTLVTGPSGAGKSTLLGVAGGQLGRRGEGQREGRVTVGGQDPLSLSPSERARRVGLVDQRPEDQVIAGRVGDDVAFAPLAAGLPLDAVRARVTEALARVGLEVGPERATAALSGGQRQRMVVAGALAGGAGLLLLDEPLAHLDPEGTEALLDVLRDLADQGTAVVLVEHRLPGALARADRVVVLDAGRVVHDGPDLPEGVRQRLGLETDGLTRLRAGLAARGMALEAATFGARSARVPGEPVAVLEGVRWRWPRGPEVLHGVDLTVRRGERVALVGPNGAGKSSLLRALRQRRHPGVRVEGRLVAVPQDPDLALFASTVREELAHGPGEQGLRGEAVTARVDAVARACDVHDLLDRPPQALSRGQRLRVAVAAALTCAPDLLLLDEPTVGQDRAHVLALLDALDAVEVGAVLLATHDLGLALGRCDRVVRLDGGRIVDEGAAGAVLQRWEGDLPPLLAWCRDRGVAPGTVEDLLDRVEG